MFRSDRDHHCLRTSSRKTTARRPPNSLTPSDRFLSPVRTTDSLGRLGWHLGSRDVPGGAGLFFVTDDMVLDNQVLMRGLRTADALHLGRRDLVTIELHTAVGEEASEPQTHRFEVFVTCG